MEADLSQRLTLEEDRTYRDGAVIINEIRSALNLPPIFWNRPVDGLCGPDGFGGLNWEQILTSQRVNEPPAPAASLGTPFIHKGRPTRGNTYNGVLSFPRLIAMRSNALEGNEHLIAPLDDRSQQNAGTASYKTRTHSGNEPLSWSFFNERNNVWPDGLPVSAQEFIDGMAFMESLRGSSDPAEWAQCSTLTSFFVFMADSLGQRVASEARDDVLKLALMWRSLPENKPYTMTWNLGVRDHVSDEENLLTIT